VDDLAAPEVRDLLASAREEMDRQADLRAVLVVLRRKNGTTFPALVLPQVFHDSQGELVGGFSVVIELATIQTAKPIGPMGGTDLRCELGRIAMELQTLGIAAGTGNGTSISFDHATLRDLTSREREVLLALLSGDRVSVIAKQLFISPHTVRNHLKAMFRKLGVSSQSELISHVRGL
jgi:DNA-binding CsgD family transcriptional regulator